MRASLKVYGTAYLVALQARLEYRVDFVVGVATALIMQLAGLSFFWVVMHQTSSLAGWSGREALLLFGMTATALGLSELFFNHIWMVPTYIVNGDLDRLLVYPVRSLLFLLVTRPELHGLGNLAVGTTLTVASLIGLHVPVVGWLLVPLWIVTGVVIYMSTLVIFCGYSFRFIGPYGYNLFMGHVLLQSTRYPVAIYPRWLHYGLLFVVPLGTFHSVPVAWLLGKGGAWWHGGAGVIAAVVYAAIAGRVWDWGLARYESTGS